MNTAMHSDTLYSQTRMTDEQRERERDSFEEWFALHFGQGKRPIRSDRHDGYWYDSTDRAWVAWLYRANLAIATDLNGMTDAQIYAIADQHGYRYRTADEEAMTFDKHAVLDFARAIAAHRNGNKQ